MRDITEIFWFLTHDLLCMGATIEMHPIPILIGGFGEKACKQARAWPIMDLVDGCYSRDCREDLLLEIQIIPKGRLPVE